PRGGPGGGRDGRGGRRGGGVGEWERPRRGPPGAGRRGRGGGSRARGRPPPPYRVRDGDRCPQHRTVLRRPGQRRLRTAIGDVAAGQDRLSRRSSTATAPQCAGA